MALGLVMSCDSRINNSVFNPRLISETDQEKIGDQIYGALTSGASPYTVLSREENENLYTYLEQLYLQSYFVLRGTYPWTNERDWRLVILEEENEGAFTLPGGHLVITTGMLKIFQAEYELYYLFSFENALMNNEEIYFTNIVSFIENTIDLEDLIENPDPQRALEIGIELYEEQSFEPSSVSIIDRLGMELICESGTWRNDGINQFLLRLDPNSIYAQSRKSAFDRLDAVNNNAFSIGCDNKVRERSPNFYVDNILPLLP